MNGWHDGHGRQMGSRAHRHNIVDRDFAAHLHVLGVDQRQTMGECRKVNIVHLNRVAGRFGVDFYVEMLPRLDGHSTAALLGAPYVMLLVVAHNAVLVEPHTQVQRYHVVARTRLQIDRESVHGEDAQKSVRGGRLWFVYF